MRKILMAFFVTITCLTFISCGEYSQKEDIPLVITVPAQSRIVTAQCGGDPCVIYVIPGEVNIYHMVTVDGQHIIVKYNED